MRAKRVHTQSKLGATTGAWAAAIRIMVGAINAPAASRRAQHGRQRACSWTGGGTTRAAICGFSGLPALSALLVIGANWSICWCGAVIDWGTHTRKPCRPDAPWRARPFCCSRHHPSSAQQQPAAYRCRSCIRCRAAHGGRSGRTTRRLRQPRPLPVRVARPRCCHAALLRCTPPPAARQRPATVTRTAAAAAPQAPAPTNQPRPAPAPAPAPSRGPGSPASSQPAPCPTRSSCGWTSPSAPGCCCGPACGPSRWPLPRGRCPIHGSPDCSPSAPW